MMGVLTRVTVDEFVTDGITKRLHKSNVDYWLYFECADLSVPLDIEGAMSWSHGPGFLYKMKSVESIEREIGILDHRFTSIGDCDGQGKHGD